jgi:uncharacterized membrane protein YqjE
MKRLLFVLILFISIPSFSFAQLEKPVTWSFYAKKINKTEVLVYIKAKIAGNWHIYAQSVKSEAMRLKFSHKFNISLNQSGRFI